MYTLTFPENLSVTALLVLGLLAVKIVTDEGILYDVNVDKATEHLYLYLKEKFGIITARGEIIAGSKITCESLKDKSILEEHLKGIIKLYKHEDIDAKTLTIISIFHYINESSKIHEIISRNKFKKAVAKSLEIPGKGTVNIVLVYIHQHFPIIVTRTIYHFLDEGLGKEPLSMLTDNAVNNFVDTLTNPEQGFQIAIKLLKKFNGKIENIYQTNGASSELVTHINYSNRNIISSAIFSEPYNTIIVHPQISDQITKSQRDAARKLAANLAKLIFPQKIQRGFHQVLLTPLNEDTGENMWINSYIAHLLSSGFKGKASNDRRDACSFIKKVSELAQSHSILYYIKNEKTITMKVEAPLIYQGISKISKKTFERLIQGQGATEKDVQTFTDSIFECTRFALNLSRATSEVEHLIRKEEGLKGLVFGAQVYILGSNVKPEHKEIIEKFIDGILELEGIHFIQVITAELQSAEDEVYIVVRLLVNVLAEIDHLFWDEGQIDLRVQDSLSTARYSYPNWDELKKLRNLSKRYEEAPIGNGILLGWHHTYTALINRFSAWRGSWPAKPPIGEPLPPPHQPSEISETKEKKNDGGQNRNE